MDHFHLITDSEDFATPTQRAARYKQAQYTPKRPMALRCWLQHTRSGTLPAQWDDIGIPPQQGQVLDVLFESGQTSAMLVCYINNEQWVLLSQPHAPRQLIRVYHVKPTGKEILWPFGHVLWTDRAVAANLIDSVVHLWPRLVNNRMDHITEPFRVVSLFLRDRKRLGLGIVPDFATANSVAGKYRARPLHETNPHDPRRFVDAEDSMNPPLVLWGVENSTEDYAVILQQRKTQTADNFDLWETADTRYAGVRLLQANPQGGDPMLWGPARSVHGVPVLDAVLSGEFLDAAKDAVLAPVPYGVKPMDAQVRNSAWWCSRCLAESAGLDKVRAVENGLCVLHLRLEQGKNPRVLSNLTCPSGPTGRHRWQRAYGRIPTCAYCGKVGHGKEHT